VFALAARLAFEVRDDETSARFYRFAEQTAGAEADRSYRAAVRTSRAMTVLHGSGDLGAASALAAAAGG
jgi:hypothetical protein